MFNEELENLLPKQNLTKDDFSSTINSLMKPKELIKVALDNTNEVVAFDEFIEPYRNTYEELGKYSIYIIENNGISYKDVLKLKIEEILKLSKNIKDTHKPTKIRSRLEFPSPEDSLKHPSPFSDPFPKR